MIILSFLYLVLSIFLFLLGLIFGIVLLFLILFLLALKKKKDFPQFKNKKDDAPDSHIDIDKEIEEKKFNFGDSTQLRWMNRLLWRAYPLLLDRHYIKVTIMEVFEQIPKDIPQIKKLRLATFKTGMTPLILDDASIHTIPKSELIFNTDENSKQNEIKRSKSNAYIDSFQEQNFQQQPYSLFKKAQRSSSQSIAHSPNLISKTNSNFDFSNMSNTYNYKQSDQNQIKVNNETNSLPPGFSIIKKIVEGNKDCSDYLKFCFHFEPDLEIGAEVELGVRLLSNMTVAANFKLHSLSGHFVVAIPPKSGPLSIGILESTIINFDITAQLGVISFNSEEWKSTWTSLKNWIHYFLHKIVINIPLEDFLQKMAEAERENENEQEDNSDKEKEKLLEMAKKRMKEREENNHKKENQEIAAPSAPETNKNQNEMQKIENDSNKNQKQLITFKHSMTLWDYEF